MECSLRTNPMQYSIESIDKEDKGFTIKVNIPDPLSIMHSIEFFIPVTVFIESKKTPKQLINQAIKEILIGAEMEYKTSCTLH